MNAFLETCEKAGIPRDMMTARSVLWRRKKIVALEKILTEARGAQIKNGQELEYLKRHDPYDHKFFLLNAGVTKEKKQKKRKARNQEPDSDDDELCVSSSSTSAPITRTALRNARLFALASAAASATTSPPNTNVVREYKLNAQQQTNVSDAERAHLDAQFDTIAVAVPHPEEAVGMRLNSFQSEVMQDLMEGTGQFSNLNISSDMSESEVEVDTESDY